MAQNTW